MRGLLNLIVVDDLFFLNCRVNRRQLLKLSLAGAALHFCAACKKHFVRPEGRFDLGEPTALTAPQSHIPLKSMLVFRDDSGWAAMSTRCTYGGCGGCDLTYDASLFFCMCCHSMFTHQGRVKAGPAAYPLPYFEIEYDKGHLWANTGKQVAPEHRFTTPELEAMVVEIRKTQHLDERGKVPDVLLGTQQRDTPLMFQEGIPDEEYF